MTKYFAYGTNCNPEVMEQKGIHFTSRARAVLHGFRLRFNKRSLRDSLPASIGFANIEKDEHGSVEGILYDLGVGGLERLDETERQPSHYHRMRVMVDVESGSEGCWTYQARPEVTAEGLLPSRNYINHILAGQEFLSQQYFDALDQSQTYRDTCACCAREEVVLFVRDADRLHTLCQGCREARLKWSDVFYRRLTVGETAAVMKQLVMDGAGFASIEELIQEAVTRNILPPPCD